jgi:carbonic anhydrase/acetyltransferase-like protein (isoleucine patch superfamily)
MGADVVIPAAAPLGRARLALLRLRGRGRIAVEGRVTLGRGVRVNVAPGARVVLGDGCFLGDGARIEAVAGEVRIGARTLVGARAIVVGLAGVSIGEDCVIGEFAAVTPGDPPLRREPVTIDDRVRIGAHAAVEGGATLAAGAVVGSYVVVAADEARSA